MHDAEERKADTLSLNLPVKVIRRSLRTHSRTHSRRHTVCGSNGPQMLCSGLSGGFPDDCLMELPSPHRNMARDGTQGQHDRNRI